MRKDNEKNRWVHKGVIRTPVQCQRSSNVLHYNEAFICEQCEIDRLQEQVEYLLMDRGRLQARTAVLTGALAHKARHGEQEWAQATLKKADEAALRVKREDLVVAHVNEARK